MILLQSWSRVRWICMAVAGTCVFSMSAWAAAAIQEEANKTGTAETAANPETPATPPAAEKSLSELLADWGILEQRMIQKEEEFNKTEDVLGKDDIKFTYTDMLREANALIDKIREVAKQELSKENGDPAALKTLMGILVNDAQQEKVEQVLTDAEFLISKQIDARYFSKAASLERLSITAKEVFEELAIRQREGVANDLPRVKLTTSQGEIVLELFENEAPNTVANFISLIEAGFYNNLSFHRVLEGFMAQSGCPQGTGMGGPGYTIACECYSPEARRHFPGSISMAKSTQRDSGGSQFFLCFNRSEDVRRLDGKHTVFGRIVSGMDILKKILPTHTLVGGQEVPVAEKTLDKILSAEVIRKREHEYKPVKVGESPAATTPPAQPTEGKIESSAAEGGVTPPTGTTEEKKSGETGGGGVN